MAIYRQSPTCSQQRSSHPRIVLDNFGAQVEELTRCAKHIPDLSADRKALKSLPALSAVFTRFCLHPANTSVLKTHKDLFGNDISLQFPKCFVAHSLWHPERLWLQGKSDLLGSTWQSQGENTLVVHMSMWSFLQLQVIIAADFKSQILFLHGIKECRGLGNKSFLTQIKGKN